MIARLLAAIFALAAQAPAVARDDPESHAFIETAIERTDVYVDQPFFACIRIGIDTAWFEKHALPVSARRLDLPVSVEAPWLQGLPDAPLLDRGPGPEGSTLALEGKIGTAIRIEDRVWNRRTFAVYRVERTLLPGKAGDLELAAPALRFSSADRIDEDPFGAAVPADARVTILRGGSPTVRVHALPAEGRPADFSGAVGRFMLSAEVSPKEVAAGGSLRLLLRVTGEGNLATLRPPVAERLDGFHVRGRIDAVLPDGRLYEYEVVPLSADVREIPAIRFPHFDPGPPAGYRVASSEAIPIRVLPGAAPPAPRRGPRETGQRDGGVRRTVLLAVILVMASVIGVIVASRRRAAARAAADPRHYARLAAAAAAAACREALAAGADPGSVLAEYLAARLEVPPAAVVTPDLAARLESAGAPAPASRAAASLMEALVAARYGSAAPPGDAAAAVLAVVEELERG